jgi:hypothetical protein
MRCGPKHYESFCTWRSCPTILLQCRGMYFEDGESDADREVCVCVCVRAQVSMRSAQPLRDLKERCMRRSGASSRGDSLSLSGAHPHSLSL